MVVTVSNHGCLQQLRQRTKRKYNIKKFPAHVFLDDGEQSLASGAKLHSHDPDSSVAEKAEFRAELRLKAADQHLSATQNLPI